MLKRFFDQFAQSSPGTKIAISAVVVVWTMILAAFMAGAVLLLEKPGQAQQPTPGGATPAIVLEPAAGPPGTTVTVRGEGWTSSHVVLIYLVAPGQTEPPNFAIAGSTADADGRFTARFVVPSEPGWEGEGLATVVAQTTEGASAQEFFSLTSTSGQPAATVVTPGQPTSTPTQVVTGAPTTTPQPGKPAATAITDLNIRAGPGTAYPVLGVLRAGQSAEVTGVSADSGWWQIQFSGAAEGHGWLAAQYVTAQNTGNVPVVQAPPLPATPTPTSTPTPTATPTPTSTPVVISDWRAEYYNNPSLGGTPLLVRNDVAINFDWGFGSPGPGLPADNFSARWTRKVDFKSGTYIFRVRVDDGVRLWVDDALLIDSWNDGSSRRIEAERQISKGKHQIKVEYYERTGAARIEVSWRRKEEPPNQPPQAVPGGPYSVDEGRPLTLDGRGSSDPDGSIVRYEWDFNYDGQAFTVDSRGQTPQTSYADGPATVTVALRVTDDQGASQVATTRVEVKNVAPVAEVGGPYTGQVGSPISMAGTATDPGLIDQAGLTYGWDFGDGTSGSGPVVSHSYAQAGSYTARLTVTDKDGAGGSDTAAVEVYAANQPPQAVIKGPASGLVGETLSFSGGGSSDSDGAIVTYAWDFGDGSTEDKIKVAHAYTQAGRYRVTLTVTDDGGLSASATQEVQIEEPPVNQPPTAVIEGPSQGLVGEALAFRGSGSSDSDGVIVKYEWDFGDGSTEDKVKVAHAYAQAGRYQVTLTVTDDGGLSASATQEIQIEEPATNQPPTAVIEGPSHGLIGETLAFRGSGSSDSDGSIIKYEWDLGDGTTEDKVKVAHAYTHAGSYQVILTVTDDGGLSDSATLAVQIQAPVPVNLPPVAVIHGPAMARVGESITFDASSSSDIEGSIVDYAWVFGDGITGSGITVTHVYTQAGSYQVALTVTDDGGLTASEGQVIQVQEMADSNLSSGPASQMPNRSQVAR
jgi:PKD repeat protein/uncharacterized protein YraI